MTDTIQAKIEALLDLARAEAGEAKSRIADDLSGIIYDDGAPFNARDAPDHGLLGSSPS